MIEKQYGTAATISFPLIEFSLTSFHNSLTTTLFAAGDIKISKDYGDYTNTSTLPSSCPGGRSVALSLTAAELQGAHIDIQVVDQTATKLWEDQMIQLETFADTTASQFKFNRASNTVQASLTAAQAGVTVATVTDITNAVNASITSTSVVQSVTNAVTISSTIPTATETSNVVWGATQSAFGVAGTFGNLLDATISGIVAGSGLTASETAEAVWGATQSVYGGVASTYGAYVDSTISGIAVATGSSDWTDGERAQIRYALGVSGSTTAGSGGIIQSISSRVTNVLDVTVSSRSTFDPAASGVSLTANQAGVTIATVTDITNAVNASITSTSVVHSVTNTVQASLTANQAGVTVATVTDVTNAVTISSTIPSATDAAAAVWNATASGYATAGRFGGLMQNTVSSFDPASDAVTATAVVVATLTSTTIVGTVNNLGASATVQVEDSVWEADLNSHTTDNTFGKRVRQNKLIILDDAGGPANFDGPNKTVTLPTATALDIDDVYNGCTLEIEATGASINPRTYQIVDYVGSTRAATIDLSDASSFAFCNFRVHSKKMNNINNLGASATSQVNAEVVDVMTVDTIAEQSAGAPPAAPTFAEMQSYLYMAWRNKIDTTANKTSVTNNAGSTITAASVSDDGITFTKGEFA